MSLWEYAIAFIIAFTVALLTNPLIIRYAGKFGFVDKPEERKVHLKSMPRVGGLSIILGTIAGSIYLQVDSEYLPQIGIGAAMIIAMGLLDDRFTLNAKFKFLIQLIAAVVVVSSGLTIEFIEIPLIGRVEMGFLSSAMAVLWIIGVMNSINLIDGLDGLAGGVATIAISTILVMAIIDPLAHVAVISIAVVLIGSTLAFLIFNFHPAKLFMGDTGSLFLGYSIAIISLMGFFKSVTLFSLIAPVLILAVPIFDTLFAIIRRFLNKQRIMSPDKGHLHHCLLAMGFSHRAAVLIIYTIGIFFGASALLFSNVTLWTAVIIFIFLLLLIQLSAEVVGLIGAKRQPLLNMMRRCTGGSQEIKK